MKSPEFITARSSRRLIVRSFFVPLLLPAMLCAPGCRTFQSKEAIPAHQTVKFLVIGCGPYTPQEEIDLGQYVDQANAQAEGEFLVHLGDIQTQSRTASSSYCAAIAEVLRRADMPTFIVPGDNEWNDQEDPERAWDFWSRSFMQFHRYWDRAHSFRKNYPVSGGVQHQEARPENFAFVRKGVLFIGINLPGGAVHDAAEWARRLPENAAWVAGNLRLFKEDVRAAVVFAQALPTDKHDAFSVPFRLASHAFGKPVLYLHADGYAWQVARPRAEQNILQVQTDQLGLAPPLLVTVSENESEPFEFDRQQLRGPYLALGTPTSMRIVWRTPAKSEPIVRFGRSPDLLDDVVPPGEILTRTKDHPDALVALHSAPEGTCQHEATVSGLAPATTYYYAVYDGDRLLAGGEESHRFKTHPAAGAHAPLRFWVVGDSGTGDSVQSNVHNAMLEFTRRQNRPIDIYLHVGDMAYGRGLDEEFDRNFFKPYRQTLRNTVCWPAMGNHEGLTSNGQTQIGPYYDCYILPAHGEAGGLSSGTEAYYSFDYGSAHFVVLDSYDLDRSPNAPMARWLASDLESTDTDWIFAYWHHPPYTKGSHDSDAEHELVEMRENIMPILEAGGVDMVFSGHSHIYERSMLIDGAYATPTTAEGVILDDGDGDPSGDGSYRKSAGLYPHEGMVAVVTGHGGAGVSRKGTVPVMRRVIHPEHGSMIVDVEGDTATVTMLNAQGEQRDAFQIIKRGRVSQTRVVDPFQLPPYGNK
jgi:hypothetical protein